VSRWGPSVDGSLTTLAVVAAGVVALSVVALQSGPGPATVAQQQNPTANGAPTGTGTTGTKGKSTTTTTGKKSGTTTGNGPTSTAPAGQQSAAPGPATNDGCNATNNGGSTDRGVSANRIELGATVVQSGIGASFLGPVKIALSAVENEVRRTGGICGRELHLNLVDDGWDPTRGYQFIQNLVEDKKVFALAVNPSSEGLRLASAQRYLERTKTPVVGSDGMLNSQYSDPWIWPIAASTVSTMHIMAQDACKRLSKKNFAIVFDTKYHFGVEGAYAFNQSVRRCTGADIPGYTDPSKGGSCSSRFCAISAGQTSYDAENKTFNDKCFRSGDGTPPCDFVALLLEPNEAQNFLRNGTASIVQMGLAQTLFTRDFASSCGSICDGALVWTGYNPAIEDFANLPAVRSYVGTVRSASPDVDVLNQFLVGGYAGMQLLVDALKRLGPNVTRQGLAQLLDSTDYDGGLTTPLRWRRGAHFANASMQAFSIQYKGGFNGFRSVTGWVRDTDLGKDVT
jgi:ABC-type branched-subunit amino acid transport system substrate-binding protein